jgi:hypothetical protein
MSKRTILGGAAAVLAAGGLGAFAATGFGGGDESIHDRAVNAGAVEFEVANAGAAASGRPVALRGRRKPVVTHLISVDPIDAYYDGQNVMPPPPREPFVASGSTFVGATCPPGTGNPIGGGIITNGAPELASDILSRFHPLTLRTPGKKYFVGVRNDGPAEESFRATLVCGKGMRVR